MTQPRRAIRAATKRESAPEILGRLGEDIATLIDTKAKLLEVEVKEDIAAYVGSIRGIMAGASIAVVGFALLGAAVALLIASLLQNMNVGEPLRYALGFAIAALVDLAAGAVVMYKMRQRMAGHDFTPERSMREVAKDRDWIKKEL